MTTSVWGYIKLYRQTKMEFSVLNQYFDVPAQTEATCYILNIQQINQKKAPNLTAEDKCTFQKPPHQNLQKAK